jgi:hypothetical protein
LNDRVVVLVCFCRYPDISLSALQSITTFVSSASLLKKFVENGAILFVINLLMFYDDENEQVNASPCPKVTQKVLCF